jgi:spore maturation protein CgeB
MGLRVLLLAKFSRRYHHTGFSLRAGLEQLGCEVATVELRDRGLDRWVGRLLARRLAGALRSHRPDLVLSYKGGELDPEVVTSLRGGPDRRSGGGAGTGGARWVNWFPDSPHHLELSLRVGAGYDLCFLFDSWMVERHRTAGRRAEFLPLGVDPAVWRPPARPGDPLPLVFVGSPEPLRDAALAAVADLGLELWGPERPRGPLFGEALVRTYARAVVALNVHQFFGEPAAAGRYGAGANQRVFELAGIGCLQLVDAKADIVRSFAPDREIVLFRSAGELRERAAALLADPAGARTIGARSRERALREHTWRHRLEELLTRSLR